MAHDHSRIDQEREYHEHYDTRRDASSLIVATYQSDLFSEAEAFYQAAGGDLRGARVLDYGCGSGAMTEWLCDRGAQPVAFDISIRRLTEAKTRCEPGNIMFVQCAAEYLPFSDGSVDVVMGKQILHHLDPDLAMPEIARVLRPGGRAVFLEPLGHNIALEAYRKLTPQLRSPTERALRMSDVKRVSSHFRSAEHHEFCFSSVAPVVLEALSRHRIGLRWAYAPLRSFDRWLVRVLPSLGRYYWETVMVLEK